MLTAAAAGRWYLLLLLLLLLLLAPLFLLLLLLLAACCLLQDLRYLHCQPGISCSIEDLQARSSMRIEHGGLVTTPSTGVGDHLQHVPLLLIRILLATPQGPAP